MGSARASVARVTAPFDIVEVELVRSVLAPSGAVHQVVASFPLPLG
jgi:hypothetical protein